ncbi:aminopeptidase P family protein [Amaricoccus tamworthensis]|uniref:aminopeptidase P family protein n=1 Tax=Amaricoccus tamworthensis TaxID=57002 RepID=UPI003C7AE5F5
MKTTRQDFFTLHNGEKAPLPFLAEEYDARLAGLRRIMAERGLDAVILTSMHGIAYYSGFLYCAFGRSYGLVVTEERSVTVSANIDLSQPWRRCHGENVIYTDWQRDNYWRAVADLAGRGKRIGVEHDHLTLQARGKLEAFLAPETVEDVAEASMRQRMVKSAAEIDLIRESARIADIGGAAIRDAIRPGTREIDVAMAGRDAVERAVAERFPDSEIRDNWVWFQSGINTDGAHNPVTTRALETGDILSLNVFPMVSGYYTALERTLFLGEPDAASREIWEANVGAHELGISLIRPGARCCDIVSEINRFFEERNLLRYRTFGYGHSFGVLSHYYGREAGLELREDIETVLEPGMVVSMEPMLTLPEGVPGAGGYREHDILVIHEDRVENITGFPYGPEHNIVGA